jgi:carboxymethylenebutenolidase
VDEQHWRGQRDTRRMIDRTLDITTSEGVMPTFATHPERGGPFPVIVMYMDARGMREELRDMARRLATTGYYCVLPDLYYRWGENVTFDPVMDHTEFDPAVIERFRDLSIETTDDMVLSDTRAILEVIRSDPAARRGPKGCIGYCIGGRHVLRALSSLPEHFAAGSSLFPTFLVNDTPDSPHLAARRATGEYYFAFGEVDPLSPPEVVATVQAELTRSAVAHDLEIHPGVTHGFVFPLLRHAYDKSAAERTWERSFSLFRRILG